VAINFVDFVTQRENQLSNIGKKLKEYLSKNKTISTNNGNGF